jgi:hypothetical protein
MALDVLVSRLHELRQNDKRFQGLDLIDSAREVLLIEYCVEPSKEEVAELAQAARASLPQQPDFFVNWDLEQESQEKQRQTGGGREVIYKSEHRGG